MKKIILYSFPFLLLFNKANAQLTLGQLSQEDSSLIHVNGEGTYLTLGKGEGTKFNFLNIVQTGIQMSQFDSLSFTSKSNRLSLNLVRIVLNVQGSRDKFSLGIVTDFTGTTPILEGWVGFSVFNKKAKVFLGQRQTNTNNRLAMADERFAQVMGQTIAGKSNDGIVYGGLMQNFVGATREGGIFFETKLNIKNFKIYPSLSVTTGEGQNFFDVQPNVGLKYGGRIDVLPFGDFTKNNAFIAHDIYRERKPKLALGFAASINSKASSPIGSENNIITNIYNKNGESDFANYRKIVADVVFKHNGFALIGEYINGNVTGTELYTNSAASNKLIEEVASTYYNIGSAFNIQSSYIFNNGWSIDGRYSTITPEFNIQNSLVHEQTWLTFGINKFIKNNSVKVGVNTTIINEKTPAYSTKRMVSNLAIQILL